MTSSSSSRARVLRIVEAAYELPESERGRYLVDACAGDDWALEEAQALMATDDSWDDFLPGDARTFIDRFKGELGRATQYAELRIQHEGLLEPLLDRLRRVGAPMERFELGERLGRGGMGEVFRAFDRVLRRDVALKRVRGEDSGSTAPSPGIQIRFLQEAQVLAQLEHPGIPTVHEIGVDEHERLFFTMPLVRGESLEEHLERVPETAPPWAEPRILEGLLQAARSIAHSHERGVIHRDLKPDNLMLGPYGAMQVVDWGIARVADTERELEVFYGDGIDALVASDLSDAATSDPSYQTMVGGALGTPSYMPPEQANSGGAEIGPHSDVYSLGAILYRVLTRTAAYSDIASLTGGPPGALELTKRVGEGPPTPARTLAPQAPRELVAICERAMQTDPADRFPSVQAFALELEAYLAGRVVASYERGTLPTLRKWASRNRALARSLALALLLAVLFLAAFQASREKAGTLTRARTGDRLLSEIPSASAEDLPELRLWRAEARRLLSQAQEDDAGESFRVLSDPQLSPLLAGSPEFGPSVNQRIAWAEAETRRSGDRDFVDEWNAATFAIAQEPAYAGLLLDRHADLAPLGADPATGLWEFAHLPSGAPPARVEGQLEMHEGSALVLVLIPGAGTAGASVEGSTAAEGPASLPSEPYFLSKYELSQGQWLRLAGYPAQFSGMEIASQLRPVTMVSWDESVQVLDAVGLRLPSEAQWGYAARAGTSTKWWIGDDWLDLYGAENLCFHPRRLSREARTDFKNRYPLTGPEPARMLDVLHGRPNPFGLHQVVGNVREWCQDVFRPGPDAAPEEELRVIRGGDCSQVPLRAPASQRQSGAPALRFMRLGLRPSRPARPSGSHARGR